jgi:hypothetical protein
MNPDESAHHIPWLAVKRVHGVWVAGCVACAANRLRSPWALYQYCTPFGASHLTKHANSKNHIAACGRFIAAAHGKKCSSSMSQVGLVGSPPATEFADVVKNLMSPETSKDIGCNHKRRALAWCLAEAKMDMERPLLQHASSICIGQDAQKGCLLVHASASCAKLQQVKCFLGYATLSGTDSYDTVATTEK